MRIEFPNFDPGFTGVQGTQGAAGAQDILLKITVKLFGVVKYSLYLYTINQNINTMEKKIGK